MKKITYVNQLHFIYDAQHRGSHYQIENCGTYRNRGELLESMAKYYRGIYTDINPNTAFNKGSDIESINASIKSSEASLTRQLNGTTKEEQITDYFNRVKSNLFIWVSYNENDNTVTEYQMTKDECYAFTIEFTRAHFSKKENRLKIRYRSESKRMIEYFENLVA